MFEQDDSILFNFFFLKMGNNMMHLSKTYPLTQLIHIALQWQKMPKKFWKSGLQNFPGEGGKH